MKINKIKKEHKFEELRALSNSYDDGFKKGKKQATADFIKRIGNLLDGCRINKESLTWIELYELKKQMLVEK